MAVGRVFNNQIEEDKGTMFTTRPLFLIYFAALAVLCGAGAAVGQGNAVQVTFGAEADVDPAVSPDGKKLAFASDRTGDFHIYIATFGEAGVVQLTQSGKDDRNPAWSPDGAKIIFESKRTGHGDLYETAADGSSGYLQITDRPDIEAYPVYAPAGAGLLFATAPYKRLRLRTRLSLVVADSVGGASNPRVLTDEGEQACFTPDGEKVVFVSHRTRNKDIWMMDAEGGLQTQLTNDQKDDENPCVSPDGEHVAFASRRTGNYDIWVMDIDGASPRQLTTGDADEKQPCWSSDGHLYFTREIDGKTNIFRAAAP